MRTAQSQWTAIEGWGAGSLAPLPDAQVVLLFGSRTALEQRTPIEDLRRRYAGAHLLGCSTAGEIRDVEVCDESLVATALHFERSRVVVHMVSIEGGPDGSRRAGEQLARALAGDGLRHVFVLSDGTQVNGSELVRGLAQSLPREVTMSGGLSGDGERFEQTLVLLDDGPRQGAIAALGLYGDSLRIGSASLGGWDPFGPERVITRSEGNVLYELDGRSALALYKQYLGEHAEGLPATGLLFPLAVRSGVDEQPIVRTILAVDEERQSMTFAGDLPEGSLARLMKANFDRLVDGAADAARNSHVPIGEAPPDLAILISCVGRKMVLGQRVEEEVEAVRDVLGESTVITGFYSYGEISPFTPGARCELHNQTMTITIIREAA